jgi:hypothetical protein
VPQVLRRVEGTICHQVGKGVRRAELLHMLRHDPTELHTVALDFQASFATVYDKPLPISYEPV